MRRLTLEPRPDWQATVENQGLNYHTNDGRAYWDESACYVFRTAEIDLIERATNELHELCIQAVDNIFQRKRLAEFDIPEDFVPWLERSWENDEHTLYGRFNFAYDGRNPPKMLEYNADTPTALVEAAVIQWFWLKDVKPDADQFNSLHERIIDFWKTLSPAPEGMVHFTSLGRHLEDFTTANYIRDCAQQAGLETHYLPIEEVGYNAARKSFVDADEDVIRTCFKLYPWEWMIREQFGPQILESRIRWFEPPWKILLSHKMILVVLWELFPECPFLLRASKNEWGGTWVKKPVCGREGANITMSVNGETVVTTPGDYEDSRCIFQDVKSLPNSDGNYAVIGSWVVNGTAAGMGIREDTSPVTTNLSRFVPHYFTSEG